MSIMKNLIFLDGHPRGPVDEHKMKHDVLAKNASASHAFIPRVSTSSYVLALDAFVRPCKNMFSLYSQIEGSATKQPADRIISQCPTLRASQVMSGLRVFDDETGCWIKLIPSQSASDHEVEKDVLLLLDLFHLP